MGGRVIAGKYELGRLLGQGGMGAVYEAVEVAAQRRVALKVIVSDALAKEPDIVARFERESRAGAAVDSPHAVRVLDSGVDPPTNDAFMVMELLAGEDLHELSRRLGPLAPDVVVRLVAQACRGLERAHEAGVVHRDIKPANMFLVRGDGGVRTLKLLDFGIAKVRRDPLAGADGSALTRTGAVLGTPVYMSPEQALGRKTVDARSDLFSLGVTMYELLSGHTPHGHRATLGELIVAICGREPWPLADRAPWLSREVVTLVHKAIERDPARRYGSAADMLRALTALCSRETIEEADLAPLPASMRASVALAATAADPGAATEAVRAPPPWLMSVDRIEKHMTLRSPLTAVWNALSDAREFGTWFGVELDGPFVQGSSTKGRTRPTQVDPEMAKLQEPFAGTPFEVVVDRIDPPRLFAFRWHPFALDPNLDYASEPMTEVVFELGEVEGGTRLTITESGFERLPPARRAAAFTSNEGGWTAQSKLIEKYLARGQ